MRSYRQGWNALNRLLHENKSFSGRETNNAFLNCGGSGENRFADVSSAIGWDFADDARAIAQVDWDHDGDLDLWVTNRTAPRLRLLENTLNNDHHFVSLLLEGNGTSTNRDGIGARVEVKLKGTPVPFLKTLHAGHSFLSQQTRHLHFGLGPEAKENGIESVSVNWIGGERELFEGVRINKRHLLKQGTGKAQSLSKRTPVKWQPIPQVIPTVDPVARTIPMPGQSLPQIITQNGTLFWNATTQLQLWSPTCSHCLEELPQWAKAKGIILLTTENDEETKKTCELLFEKHAIDQEVHMLTQETMELLDAFQSSLIDIWLPLPVPSSFLVTQNNEVLAVYRGPASTELVQKDRALEEEADRRKFATPFSGIWIADQPVTSPLRVAKQLQGRGADDQAILYLQTALKAPSPGLSKHELTDAHLMLGQLLGKSGRPYEAIAPLKKAIELVPEDVRVALLLAAAYQESGDLKTALKVNSFGFQQHPANLNLLQQRGELQYSLKKWAEAIQSYKALLKKNPSLTGLNIKIAEAHCLTGTPDKALVALKNSLRSNPRYLEAASQLSRILSTHPDDSIRSPQEALMLAERLCQITKNQKPSYLFTKALALANVGKFQESEVILTQLTQITDINQASHSLSLNAQSALATIKSGKPIRNSDWPSL